MRLTDVERSVRRLARPEPPAELRARVLEDAEAMKSGVWRARVAPAEVPHATGELVVLSGRRWRRAAGYMALAALIVVGSCTGLDSWAGRQVDAEIARIEARYGSLALSTLTVSPVPPEDNRALVVKDAAALTVARAPYYGPPWPASPVGPESRAFAESNRAAIRIAEGVRSRRLSNWNVDYAGGQHFPPDEPIRVLSDAISTAARVELDAGRADAASAMIATGLGVTASLRQEPDLVAQVIRASNLGQRQLVVVREIVTRSEPSAQALDDLATWLAANRSPDPVILATLSTLKQANAIFARMENGDIDPDLAALIYPSDWIPLPSHVLGAAMRVGRPLVRRTRLRFLQESAKRLDVLTTPFPHAPLPWWDYPERWNLLDRVMQTMTDKFTRHRSWSVGLSDGFMSALAATELAVALRRYKINHGEYPDNLSSLVPLYLDHLPIDPSTGQPPIYAREGAGFTIRARESSEYTRQWYALEWDVSR